MFDPNARVFTRAALCDLSGVEVHIYKNLKQSGDWPFGGDGESNKWLRYSADEVVIAAAMRNAVDPSGYGLSWKLARMVATGGGHSAAWAVLKDRYDKLTPREAADALGEPWSDRGVDIWCGYARVSTTARPGEDIGGVMLPAGTLKKLYQVVADHDFDNRDARRGHGEKISNIYIVNVSQIVREIDARAKKLGVAFPVIEE